MINFRNIPSEGLEKLIKELDTQIAYVQSEFGIELKSYGNILRVAINAIQNEAIENLIERISINRELERGLENAGGYTINYLEGNNPKKYLIEILHCLKKESPKQNTLLKFLHETEKSVVAVFDNNDIDFLKSQIRNEKVEIISYSDLKNYDIKNKTLVFHSFNGQKDFDYLYNLENEIQLIVYKEEQNLYYKFLSQRKKQIEQELKSSDRFAISEIKYQEVKEDVTDVSSTINGIVSRLDEMNIKSYEGYKSECDLLLNDIEEKLLYKITSDLATLFLESNDTLFTDRGELIKCYKIKTGDKIRIYPKDQLAENLYQVAIETEPEVFGRVEEHSKFWKQIISELRKTYGNDMLYKKLKENGLRVRQTTLDTYGGEKSLRKFPMFNNDIKAILRLHFIDKVEAEIDTILKPILKSKSTYNSTMIVLGRGLKQELRLFLKEQKIGEILRKRNLNATTLQAFIRENMPVHTITNKEALKIEIENLEHSALELIEL